MKRDGLKAFGLLFRFLLLFQLYHHHQFTLVGAIENRIESNLNDEWSNVVENRVDLNERMKKIEDRNRHQEQEITFLKTNAIEDRKEINQLKLRVAQLEGSSTVASSLVRTKRLYRLLPITNEKRSFMQFYGPAANCDELGKLGYTLNGYYLVKKMQQEMQNHEGVIGVVYCLFQQPLKGPGKKDIEEERIGYIVLQSKMNLTPRENRDGKEGKFTAVTTIGSRGISPSQPISEAALKKSDCNHIFFFKAKNLLGKKSCLAVQEKNDSLLIPYNHIILHRNCNQAHIERWAWRNGTHICNTKLDGCLTFFRDQNHINLHLAAYNPTLKSQKWKTGKTGEIWDVDDLFCLYGGSPIVWQDYAETPVLLNTNKACISWSLVLLYNISGQPFCANWK